jgi:exonuclease SbcC
MQQLKTRIHDLTQEYGIQQSKVQIWQVLNELIGSSDGQKFRKFAQKITLEFLILRANEHLKELDNRYQLLTTCEMEFAIRDQHQGGLERSVKTLSGGESFFISLALALGLSDIASQNNPLQSLFLDEGFGALDDKTLHQILTALEKLRFKGKIIGLISHVESLKERLHVQILVERIGLSGWSQLRLSRMNIVSECVHA